MKPVIRPEILKAEPTTAFDEPIRVSEWQFCQRIWPYRYTKLWAMRCLSAATPVKISKARALEGHAPTRSDTFEDPDVLAKYPYYRQALDVVASGMSFPIFTYSAQYEDVLGRQLSLAGSGDVKPDTAIKAAATGLDELLKKAQ